MTTVETYHAYHKHKRDQNFVKLKEILLLMTMLGILDLNNKVRKIFFSRRVHFGNENRTPLFGKTVNKNTNDHYV